MLAFIGFKPKRKCSSITALAGNIFTYGSDSLAGPGRLVVDGGGGADLVGPPHGAGAQLADTVELGLVRQPRLGAAASVQLAAVFPAG